MPGFIIGDIKKDTNNLNVTSSEYYTNFFWDVTEVLSRTIKLNDGTKSLLALKECKLPAFSVEEEKVFGSSLDYKFAKKITYEDVSVAWYDNTGLLPIMKDWMNSILSPDRRLALASNYKYNTTIQVHTPSKSSTQKYTLVQSWPRTIKFGDLTYTSSDIKYVEATLSYDFADYVEEVKK